MLIPDPPFGRLRMQLEARLTSGMPEDPVAHAGAVAEIAAILHEAFDAVGIQCTLVGGGAIEIHAPGVYKSGDIDVVLERSYHALAEPEAVFEALGFSRRGRHWTLGKLLVETPPGPVSDPAEFVRVGELVFRVVSKETVLADRVKGFKHWGVTAYGEQAIDMLAAFGDELDMEWLRGHLEKEAAWDAFLELAKLARSSAPVAHESLRDLLTTLVGRQRRAEGPGDGPDVQDS